MDNPHNLPAASIKRIESLDASQLKALRRRYGKTDSATDDEVRQAIAEHVGQGGNLDDALAVK